MKKVIAYVLFGNQPRYINGLIPNIELVEKYYPDFECWIYVHKPSVPKHIISQLETKIETIKSYSSQIFKIIYRDTNLCKDTPKSWRFEPIDDPEVDILISRDIDSRIYEKEVVAVNEWINSGKLFHIMRDNIGHTSKILAGMFGTRKNPKIPLWKELIEKYYVKGTGYTVDEDFLGKIVYNIVKDDAMVHTSSVKYPGEDIHSFTNNIKNIHEKKFFIGQIII
jgi:hypothetical protein